MSIGAVIKKLREQKKISQIELAKILEVTDKAISSWETDSKMPRMGKVQQMSEFFGVPKSYIIEGEFTKESKKEEIANLMQSLSPQHIELFVKLITLSINDISKVIEYVEFLNHQQKN